MRLPKPAIQNSNILPHKFGNQHDYSLNSYTNSFHEQARKKQNSFKLSLEID